MLHRLRVPRLVSAVGGLCLLWGLLAPTIAGTSPWTAEHEVLSSTTDWVVYTAPSWARQCLIKNEHASGTAFVGAPGSTGTFNSSTSEYVTLPAGASLTIPLSSGTSTTPTDHLAIPIASSTASLPIGVYCTAAAP